MKLILSKGKLVRGLVHERCFSWSPVVDEEENKIEEEVNVSNICRKRKTGNLLKVYAKPRVLKIEIRRTIFGG